MSIDEERSKYVEEYYKLNYADGVVDEEIRIVGFFLSENAIGKVLDCGCGPVPQIWAMCMPKMVELHAIDLPIESILFVKDKLDTGDNWIGKFSQYKIFAKNSSITCSKRYLFDQVKKVISVQQSDMTVNLPFTDNCFDTIISLYSLGVLNNFSELENAMLNITHALKSGGIFLHINTNGNNKNTILPEYTWRGLNQTSSQIEFLLKKNGFEEIQVIIEQLHNSNTMSMYKYDTITLIKAKKK